MYAQIDWHDFVVVETVDFMPDERGAKSLYNQYNYFLYIPLYNSLSVYLSCK